jgi:hypothetical protein
MTEVKRMALLAYCPYCERKVHVSTILGGSSLKDALNNDLDIVVVHVSDDLHEGNHTWKLNHYEKENLRNAIDLIERMKPGGS